ELHHPGIVRYVAHGFTSAEQPYLAMEWLEGEDLSVRLGHHPMTIRQTVTLAQRIADALGAAHDRGLVHRDVKPSNIFLPAGQVERAKIIDFGIVRMGRSARPSTRTGLMLGTPGYMSPEQARGMRGVDCRADIFALGCVLFQCLTGEPAFSGDDEMAV